MGSKLTVWGIIWVLLLLSGQGVAQVADSVVATIWLPDNLSGVPSPLALTYSPLSGLFYIGSRYGNRLAVVNGWTWERISSLEVGWGPRALSYNYTGNKLYCADFYDNTVTVIDALSNAVITTLDVGTGPSALIFNPDEDKIYCANCYDASVSIIDGEGDSIIKTVAVTSGPTMFAYNRKEDKIYCGGYDVSVIDGATDEVVREIPVLGRLYAMAYSSFSSQDKFYYSHSSGPSGWVSVVEGGADTVIASVAVGNYPQSLTYNWVDDKVYCPVDHDSLLAIISGTGDTLISALKQFAWPVGVAYNPTDNKVYCSDHGTWPGFKYPKVSVIDGVTDNITATITGGGGEEIIYAATTNTALCTYWYNSHMLAIDGNTDTSKVLRVGGRAQAFCQVGDEVWCADYDGAEVDILDSLTFQIKGRIPVGRKPYCLIYNLGSEKVYCSNYQDATLSIISAVHDSLIATIEVGTCPTDLAYNPINNKIYCISQVDNLVTVINGETDGIIGHVYVESYPHSLLYLQQYNKVYCTNEYSGTVSVIDGATNGVIETISVGGQYTGYPAFLAYDSTTGKVYCNSSSSSRDFVTVIDPVTDDSIATIPIRATSIAIDHKHHKLYCANSREDYIKVVDCSADTITTTIYVGQSPADLVFNPTNNRLYCANSGGTDYSDFDNSVSVIDCLTDEVVATVTVGQGPDRLFHSPQNNIIYCGNHQNSSISVVRCSQTGVEGSTGIASNSLRFNLWPNYPNPFNSVTKIRYAVPRDGYVKLEIFNILGEKVATLVDRRESSGYKSLTWDASKFASGGYFCRLQSGGFTETRSMVLLK